MASSGVATNRTAAVASATGNNGRVFIQNSRNALNALAEIRNIGVGLALDDFGSGYSSFGYLADFNLDQLKIDRSFLSGLESSKKKQNIVRGIIALANLRKSADKPPDRKARPEKDTEKFRLSLSA
ncbi:EAL domain-containing protein [Mesorhizobium sp. M1328]|uniref:EAL domain-containing protein n=1 Tax=Mesorhizobium sp. M1328 TaxID=2957082 RepID=UPI003336EE3C